MCVCANVCWVGEMRDRIRVQFISPSLNITSTGNILRPFQPPADQSESGVRPQSRLLAATSPNEAGVQESRPVLLQPTRQAIRADTMGGCCCQFLLAPSCLIRISKKEKRGRASKGGREKVHTRIPKGLIHVWPQSSTSSLRPLL